MSQFTPETDFRIEFDGDVVTGSMKRLLRGDMLRMMPETGAAEVIADGPLTRLVVRASLESQRLAVEVLPSYITKFEGLRVGGEAVSAEVFFEKYAAQTYFTRLVVGLEQHLLSTSYVKADGEEEVAEPGAEEAEKKSALPSASSSPDSSGGKASPSPG